MPKHTSRKCPKPKSSPRYQMGYSDGSGSDDTIYDVKLNKPIAVVSWGCSCCKIAKPEDVENGKMIVEALNAREARMNRGKKKN